MPMYALATIPLIEKIDGNAKQVWYADDASVVGSIRHLTEWWDKLSTVGPNFGYHANAMKTWLVTKKDHLASATTYFLPTQG